MSNAASDAWEEATPPHDAPPGPASASDIRAAVSKDGIKVDLSTSRMEDKYDIGKPIGKGKFSTVYKAVRRADGVPVALKQIAIFDIMDEKSREKCLKEIKLVQSLDHENIIKYLDGFIQDKHLILAFEYAEAGDLKRQLRKAREKEARFDERVIWKYFCQIVAAVAHMHSKRIMHRDLKPANIFLTLNGTIKVGDLGLGRLLSENTIEAHSKVGTPLYMSPEVLKGKGYEWRSDVWSLGCILYELAMLRSPFKEDGLNLYGLFQKITKGEFPPISTVYSPKLRQLVADMLNLDPGARPEVEEVYRVALEMRDSTAKARETAASTEAAIAKNTVAAAASTVTANATSVTPSVTPITSPRAAAVEGKWEAREAMAGTDDTATPVATEVSRSGRPTSAHHSRRPGSARSTAKPAVPSSPDDEPFANLRVRTGADGAGIPGQTTLMSHYPVAPIGQPSPMDSPDAVVPYSAIMEVAKELKTPLPGRTQGVANAGIGLPARNNVLRSNSFFPDEAHGLEDHGNSKPPLHGYFDAAPAIRATVSRPSSATYAKAPSSPLARSVHWTLSDMLEMCEGAPAVINSTLVDMALVVAWGAPTDFPPEFLANRLLFCPIDSGATSKYSKFSILLEVIRQFGLQFSQPFSKKVSDFLSDLSNGRTPLLAVASALVSACSELSGVNASMISASNCQPSVIAQGAGPPVLRLLTVCAFLAQAAGKRPPAFMQYEVPDEGDEESEVDDEDDLIITPASEEAAEDIITVVDVTQAGTVMLACGPDEAEGKRTTDWFAELNRIKPKLTIIDRALETSSTISKELVQRGATAVPATAWSAHLQQMSSARNRLPKGGIVSDLDVSKALATITDSVADALSAIRAGETRISSITLRGGTKVSDLMDQYSAVAAKHDDLRSAVERAQRQVADASLLLADTIENMELTVDGIDAKTSDYSATDKMQHIRKALTSLRAENRRLEMQLGVVRATVLQRQLARATTANGHRAIESDNEEEEAGT